MSVATYPSPEQKEAMRTQDLMRRLQAMSGELNPALFVLPVTRGEFIALSARGAALEASLAALQAKPKAKRKARR